MSGAIVIDGMDRYYPEIKKMKEKILILRDAELEHDNPSSVLLKSEVQLAPYGCGAATGEATRCLRSMAFLKTGVREPVLTEDRHRLLQHFLSAKVLWAPHRHIIR
jgi:hypothetical protein